MNTKSNGLRNAGSPNRPVGSPAVPGAEAPESSTARNWSCSSWTALLEYDRINNGRTADLVGTGGRTALARATRDPVDSSARRPPDAVAAVATAGRASLLLKGGISMEMMVEKRETKEESYHKGGAERGI